MACFKILRQDTNAIGQNLMSIRHSHLKGIRGLNDFCRIDVGKNNVSCGFKSVGNRVKSFKLSKILPVIVFLLLSAGIEDKP